MSEKGSPAALRAKAGRCLKRGIERVGIIPKKEEKKE